jgi:hypothetical protein
MKTRGKADLPARVRSVLAGSLGAWDRRAAFTLRTRADGDVEVYVDSPRFAAWTQVHGIERAHAELGLQEEFSAKELRRIRLLFKSTV